LHVNVVGGKNVVQVEDYAVWISVVEDKYVKVGVGLGSVGNDCCMNCH